MSGISRPATRIRSGACGQDFEIFSHPERRRGRGWQWFRHRPSRRHNLLRRNPCITTLSTITFKFLGLIGLLAIVAGIGAAAFFFGGFFDVGADHPDPDIVNWVLIQVRKASIARHADDQPPASLEDPALVRAGARAFAEVGCINCHGGPGVKPAKFSEGLNPPPNSTE